MAEEAREGAVGRGGNSARVLFKKRPWGKNDEKMTEKGSKRADSLFKRECGGSSREGRLHQKRARRLLCGSTENEENTVDRTAREAERCRINRGGTIDKGAETGLENKT